MFSTRPTFFSTWGVRRYFWRFPRHYIQRLPTKTNLRALLEGFPLSDVFSRSGRTGNEITPSCTGSSHEAVCE